MKSIEKEILSATKELKKGRKEDNDDYLTRLVKALHSLDDDSWEDLSKGAQQWFNDAAEAVNKKKQLPGFSDGDSDDDIGKRSVGKKDKKSDDSEVEGIEDLEEGMEVCLYGKKDKVLAEGEVVKVGKKTITILEDNEDEETISVSRIKKIDFLDSKGNSDKEEDDPESIDAEDLEEGMEVTFEYDEEEIEGVIEKVKKKAVWIEGEKYIKDDISDLMVKGDVESGETIDPSDVEKGMNVSIEMKNGDTVEGEVVKLKEKDDELKIIFIGDDKERCAVSKIVSIVSMEEGDPDGETDDGEDELSQEIISLICKFPKMKMEKIVAKVVKSKIDTEDEDLITEFYDSTHVIIDLLKEHGKLA